MVHSLVTVFTMAISQWAQSMLASKTPNRDDIQERKQVEALFNLLGVTCDGFIDKDDWATAFQSIDKDKKGFISRKEWSKAVSGDVAIFDMIKKKRFARLSLEEWNDAFN